MAVVRRAAAAQSSAACAEPLHWHFYDAPSGTLTHLVACPRTRRAALIDPVLGFSPAEARLDHRAAEAIADLIRVERLRLDWVLETHVHADHVSAAQLFKTRCGARVGIGAQVCAVQRYFVELFDLAGSVATDGSQFDRLWRAHDRFELGQLEVRVLATPGHTFDGVTYVVGRHAFVGDTVFRPSFGTARCDLAGGDPGVLFESIQRLYALPFDTLLHLCHDYPPPGAPPVERASVDEQRCRNVHLTAISKREDFVGLRRARDATLPVPALLIPAAQINIAAGRLPAAAANGVSYLKVPLNMLGANGGHER